MSFDLAPLQNLIDQFERMQGIGHKTAQRMAFYVLGLSDEQAREFAQAITDAHTKIKQCKVCCNLADDDLCPICKSKTRDKSTICVVQDPRDVAAIERTHEYNGTYHVLHGAISPMDNIGPDQIRIKELVSRLGSGEVEEVKADRHAVHGVNDVVHGEGEGGDVLAVDRRDEGGVELGHDGLHALVAGGLVDLHLRDAAHRLGELRDDGVVRVRGLGDEGGELLEHGVELVFLLDAGHGNSFVCGEKNARSALRTGPGRAWRG